jgi:hypothetical protein
LKNKVAQDYFKNYDCTKIIGNIDFSVSLPITKNQDMLLETPSLLWAEAKRGNADIYNSIVQLILTIGKARTFDKKLPPPFLGAFDAEKMALIPYNEIHEIFYQNDFNWNVTPSNHDTEEFKTVLEKVTQSIDTNYLLFSFETDTEDLKRFIEDNFVAGKVGTSKIKIDKNNFMVIYNKWLKVVKPTIEVRWEVAQKTGIIDGDFYLADLLSKGNETLKDKLFVLLKRDHYELDRKIDEMGMFNSKTASFNDNRKAHQQFWNRYERPPKQEYWDYIVKRRDLLVPQDVRERKGSFFTPQIWVELSQKYLTDVLGEDWQDEHYIWDCAAGTGNLLNGLTNKYNIWASTLDTQDVEVMKDRIKNGANLLENHIFQFDFLNDDFDKLPSSLKSIIDDPEKRKKLVIYINPPYAEHGNRAVFVGKGKHKSSVATTSEIYKQFNKIVGTATRELYAQFFLRIFKEIPNITLASFSTLKLINSPNFYAFRDYFKVSFEKGFVVAADTFDNVKGKFPIGFLIWRLDGESNIDSISTDVFDEDLGLVQKKRFFAVTKNKYLINWFRPFIDRKDNELGSLHIHSNDVQQQNVISIKTIPSKSDLKQKTYTYITRNNLIAVSIYYTCRKFIIPTWLNNKDQFLYPNEDWKKDKEFKSDCLTYTLFSNNVQSEHGINNWIPYTEEKVDAKEKFESNFMTQYIKGKIKIEQSADLFDSEESQSEPLIFSDAAKSVFDAGQELWKYYHQQPNINANASLYDIRAHFQGRNAKGRMNSKSDDKKYMELIKTLRNELKELAKKIEPKVYKYEFLKE